MADEDFTSDDVPNRRLWMQSRGGTYGGIPASNESRCVRPLMSVPYMYSGGPAPPPLMGGPRFGSGGSYWRPPRGPYYDRPFDMYGYRGGPPNFRGGRPRHDGGANHFRPQKRPYRPHSSYGHGNNSYERNTAWNSNPNYGAGAPQSNVSKWQCPHTVKNIHCLAVMLENPWEALERVRSSIGRHNSADEAASKLRDAKLEEGGTPVQPDDSADCASTSKTSDPQVRADADEMAAKVSASCADDGNTAILDISQSLASTSNIVESSS